MSRQRRKPHQASDDWLFGSEPRWGEKHSGLGLCQGLLGGKARLGLCIHFVLVALGRLAVAKGHGDLQLNTGQLRSQGAGRSIRCCMEVMPQPFQKGRRPAD